MFKLAKSFLYMTVCLLCFVATASQAREAISITDTTIVIKDNGIWHRVNNPPARYDNWTPSLVNTAQEKGAIIDKSGTYITKISLRSSQKQNKFVVLNSNYVDQGFAYWEPVGGSPQLIAEFSQTNDKDMPHLMHAQSFPLVLKDQEEGSLWVLISARKFATPVNLTFFSQPAFYQYLFAINSITLSCIAIMFTLAFIALLIAVKTKQVLSFWCAGYLGSHALSWVFTSGLANDLFSYTSVNMTYGALYIFPIINAFAAFFTTRLFECKIQNPRLHRLLISMALVLAVATLMLPFVPFDIAYQFAHILAAIWSPLSIYIGIIMWSKKDFRAKYYLTGNVVYGLAVIYILAAHTGHFDGLLYPEMVVLVAIVIDCLCILLSLAEWLLIRQNTYKKVLYEARVDALTKVGNRFALSEKLNLLGKDYLVVYIDLDGIKSINDNMGHASGDQLLKEVSLLMKQRIRHLGEVFRHGGDEFVWVINKTSSSNTNLNTELTTIIGEIEKSIQESWPTVGISYGIVNGQEGQNHNSVLEKADRLMYEHKVAKKSPIQTPRA
ncbi:diguanylate cyclase [Neptunomonas phycophila]